MKDIVILGSKGFAKEVLWLLEGMNEERPQWNFLGFVDTNVGEEPIPGYSVIGNDEWLAQYSHPINAVCGLGSPSLRQNVIKRFKNSQISFPNIVAKQAAVSKHARFGLGCIVCANVLISPDVTLGDFVTVNLSCTVGHEALLEDFIPLSPGAHISGAVHIGSGSEIGTGACIIQGKQLGPDTVVGAGSVIIRDVPGHCTIVGNPGRILKR